jgi:hypothetical protein
MIATFRSESKRALWMALVLTIAVISLTDATAGEQRRMRMRMKEPAPPEAQAVIDKLDQLVTIELSGASIEDVLHAVSNKTGVTINVAEGAIGEAARSTKFISLKAGNVPAHIVLIESLHAADLALRFDANGATVEKMEEGEDLPEHIHLRTDGPDAEGEERVIIRERSGKPGVRQPIDVELDKHESDGGAVRRKVTFRGSEGGQAEGTFELEVTREGASPQR